MEEYPNGQTRARLRAVLAVGYALIITYASLSPFAVWEEQGLSFIDVLRAPLKLTYTPFDSALNLLSYVPLGLLLCLTLLERFSLRISMLAGLIAGVLLSAGLEYLQMFVPTRVSSNMDILSNSAGTFVGTLLAATMSSRTWLFSGLIRWRSHVFQQGIEMDFGLALLVLWVFGQINPSLPMLGNVFINVAAPQPFSTAAQDTFNGWETCAVMLNLVMPGVLLLTLLRRTHKVMVPLLAILGGVALAKFVTAAILLKSWALWLWMNSEAMLGMMLGLGIIFYARLGSRSVILWLGAFSSVSYFGVTNWLFDENTPRLAKPLFHWHYGHLLTYSGLAQTIALIFPLLLLFHLWRIRKIMFVTTDDEKGLP
jgi:VanZ family protein